MHLENLMNQQNKQKSNSLNLTQNQLDTHLGRNYLNPKMEYHFDMKYGLPR